MKRQGELTIEQAETIYGLTSIVKEGMKDAAFMKLVSMTNEECGVRQRFVLLNSAKAIIGVLETIFCNKANTCVISETKIGFEIAKDSKYPNIAKGLLMKEYDDEQSNTHNMEMLFECKGETLRIYAEKIRVGSETIHEEDKKVPAKGIID